MTEIAQMTIKIFPTRNRQEEAEQLYQPKISAAKDLKNRTVPSDKYQAKAIVDILLRFNWTYVSYVASAGEYGQTGIEIFLREARAKNICIATAKQIPPNPTYEIYEEIIPNLRKAHAKPPSGKSSGGSKSMVLEFWESGFICKVNPTTASARWPNFTKRSTFAADPSHTWRHDSWQYCDEATRILD
ncbi:putative Metabotropic glutamate receptor 3 [Hypsibius exemplaris]|uniref:Metabotropic glutamate receptor 3 n=1 Tax=Hypsibius exemplaris TaxID=2072580 RepID=A0A9X6NJC3_HYPEX|nr:putative Metabotropic glutamate receptor 3 [Hypsibius exemplaris]